MEEESLEELIEETKEDFRNASRVFHEIFPNAWKKLLEACINDLPRESLTKILEKSEIGLAEAREKVTKIWNENIDGIFSLIKKQFKAPIKLKEAEIRALALTNLLEEAVRFVIEELRTLDMMQEEIQKAKAK